MLIMKYLKYFFVFFLMALSLSAEAKTLKFALVSDIHYIPSLNSSGQRNLSISGKALNGLIARLNEGDYDFVVFLGDNIDKSKEKNLIEFLNQINRIKAPYYIVLGNTDVHKISGLSKQEFIEIYNKNSKSKKLENTSYTFSPSTGIECVVLDGVSSFMPSTHGIFTEKTLKWYDETLTKNENKAVLVFQHIPYQEPFKDDSHDIMDKHLYRYILEKHKNIFLIASGHYHKGAFMTDENGVNHISAPSLSTSPYQFLEIEVSYNKKPFSGPKNLKLNGKLREAL